MFLSLSLFSSLLFKIMAVVITLAIGGMIAVRRANRIEVQFRKLAEELNLNLTRTSEEYGFDIVQLDGTIDGYRVLVVNSPMVKRKGSHAVNIRVYCRTNTSDFLLKKTSGLAAALPSIMQSTIPTGNDQFDSEFRLTGANEYHLLRIFDSAICAEFSSNAESFIQTEVIFHDGILEFREEGQVRKDGQRERLREIIPFMVHLAEKIDSTAEVKLIQ